ncbi:MAG TPA: thioredoxin domain-containing protein [Bryobacteraceae bacterium]|nr:thioredoxin domain-containing protein [Bryobacteraceae bacterium]
MNARLLLTLLASTVGLSGQQPVVEGLSESKVRVLIYEDLQCPDCADFRHLMDDKLLPRYATRVAFIHRDFPLAKHAWARQAAVAARYFAERKPELGLAYRRQILASIQETTADNFKERLAQFARANGVDPAAAVAALNDARLASLVERDFQDGVARGVVHTPTVFVNGRAFIESISFEDISEALDDALAGR